MSASTAPRHVKFGGDADNLCNTLPQSRARFCGRCIALAAIFPEITDNTFEKFCDKISRGSLCWGIEHVSVDTQLL